MKKALFISTIVEFLSSFEKSDISILQSMGYEVHCACNTDNIVDENKVQTLLDMGVRLHYVPFSRSPYSIKNIRSYNELKNIIKKQSIELVHCHTPVGGALGRLAANACRVPVTIYTAHGFHFFKGCPLKNRAIYYPVEKVMSRFTDVLITINNEDYQIASKKFHAKKTERIHGVGIDIDKFKIEGDCRESKRKELGIPDGKKMLLSVGELSRDKNHIELLEAMKILGNEGYILTIAGTGSLMESHSRFVKENKIEDCVRLLGYRKDVPELLQAADMYVFPSLFEGISVALMEAVAAKMPIACSEVRGNVDTVITRESYFPTDDPPKLVEVIRNISIMPEDEKRKMIEVNYNNLLKYSLSEVQKEMNTIYKAADDAVEKAREKV